ncbi:hypothetical protein ACFE04_012807 [Oxalis oulophora]
MRSLSSRAQVPVRFSTPAPFQLRRCSSFLLHHNNALLRFHALTHRHEFNGLHSSIKSLWRSKLIMAMDDDSFGMSSFDDWAAADYEATDAYMMSSSGDDSDSDIIINSINDFELPSVKVSTHDALKMTAHRLAMLGRARKAHRIKLGALLNLGLITFLTMLLLLVDWCAWKIVRLPLPSDYLSRPFFMSAILASLAGYICIPLLHGLNVHQIITRGPIGHSKKRRTPTMGGLFFVPIGVAVAMFIAGFKSVEVSGAAVATLLFAGIGLLDDILSVFKNRSCGLLPWTRITLEVAVGISFSFWLGTANISSPYGMKMLVPLPEPLGLVFLGKCYMLLTSFCFVSMANGINLTDGLDGLAGGTAALAFVAMSIAVLPICPDLSIFGASMAGSCVGFLWHNRHRASVFMGDTGSLALGGALAAMASCTGMFFPLFISSGIFALEASSVIMQVLYFKTTKRIWGVGQRFFRMAPFHHHLELCGLREPMIVAIAYFVASILALSAGYIGLISA